MPGAPICAGSYTMWRPARRRWTGKPGRMPGASCGAAAALQTAPSRCCRRCSRSPRMGAIAGPATETRRAGLSGLTSRPAASAPASCRMRSSPSSATRWRPRPRMSATGCPPTSFGYCCRLLLLTGDRRDGIVGLRREWIDLGRGLIRLPDKQNRREADRAVGAGSAGVPPRATVTKPMTCHAAGVPCAPDGWRPDRPARRREQQALGKASLGNRANPGLDQPLPPADDPLWVPRRHLRGFPPSRRRSPRLALCTSYKGGFVRRSWWLSSGRSNLQPDCDRVAANC